MGDDRDTGVLLRELTPRVLQTLVRRHRDFASCEDAVQEALLAAATQWPEHGVPNNPTGWLVHVATRRLTDVVRAETARRLREHLVVAAVPIEDQIAHIADAEAHAIDEVLALAFMCCHPALSPSSQVALTLRAVAGLTTAEIARAFLVPESTMAQRISRAKQTIRSSGVPLVRADGDERTRRLPAVLQVLYLTFNEGYAASAGDAVHRIDLGHEALRVARILRDGGVDEPELDGLIALMLLTDARRHARVGALGELIPIDAQDRSRWDRDAIAEGVALLERTLGRGVVGPYQIQAAIAALHDEAATFEATDWPQIRALYEVLIGIADSPMARLSHAVALAMVEGPDAGLAVLDALAGDPRLTDHLRMHAVRAHLLERAGRTEAAIAAYRRAAARTASTPERSYLLLHAARLAEA